MASTKVYLNFVLEQLSFCMEIDTIIHKTVIILPIERNAVA